MIKVLVLLIFFFNFIKLVTCSLSDSSNENLIDKDVKLVADYKAFAVKILKIIEECKDDNERQALLSQYLKQKFPSRPESKVFRAFSYIFLADSKPVHFTLQWNTSNDSKKYLMCMYDLSLSGMQFKVAQVDSKDKKQLVLFEKTRALTAPSVAEDADSKGLVQGRFREYLIGAKIIEHGIEPTLLLSIASLEPINETTRLLVALQDYPDDQSTA